MTAGIISLSARWSPNSCSLLSILSRARTLPFAVSHAVASSNMTRTMFHKANEAYKSAAPSQQHPPAKQFLPSSSPSSHTPGIRDFIRERKLTSSMANPASDTATAVSAKNTQGRTKSPDDGTSSAANRGHPSKISTLYSANSDSFKSEPSSIDLTGIDETPSKTFEPVYFAEEDFSDDSDLDLDFKAPLPVPVPLAKEKPPPSSMSIQSQGETLIPWSSSPVSHKQPPRNQPTVSAAYVSLKRAAPVEIIDDPTPKKVKRVLPAGFKKEQSLEAEGSMRKGFAQDGLSTTAQKRKAPWDASASAIQEQRKALKTQHNSRTMDSTNNDPSMGPVTEMPFDIGEQIAKAAPITLSSEQEHVLDMVVNQGQSVFFTGPAGTGKSVLMRAIIQELKRKHRGEPDRVAVTASTGLAACNIGGVTLHSFSGIGLGKDPASVLVKKVRRNVQAKTRWLRTKCLIIDEISMVDGDLFDKLSMIGRTIRNNGRPWGGIQLIITGDFFQLPPVPDRDTRDAKFAFDAATWSTSIDHTIGLTQVFRQRDPNFAKMLNEMRIGQLSTATVNAFRALARPLNFDDGVDTAELYPTRVQVEASNEKRLRDLPGKAYRYDAIDTGVLAIRDKLLANMMAPKALELKVGAQVMLIKNLDESLVNGSLGKVIAFSDEGTFEMDRPDMFDDSMDDSMAKAKRKLAAFSRNAQNGSTSRKYPVVQFISSGGSPRVLLCQPEEWKVELPDGEIQAKRTQIPLILAWALSIHKAQGQTLERVTVNLGKVFEKGQAYVALSRATTQQGLRVLGFDKSKVMAHPKVVDFYGRLYSVEAAKAKPATDFFSAKSHQKGMTSVQ